MSYFTLSLKRQAFKPTLMQACVFRQLNCPWILPIVVSTKNLDCTTFNRHKWPLTEMHTTFNTIFGHSFSCSFTWCYSFCSECQVEKPLSHWLKFFNSQSETSISRFLELTRGTKWITSCERAWKTVPKNDVGVCVHFCLRPLVPLERCEYLYGKVLSSW